jgi:hypothetical protein
MAIRTRVFDKGYRFDESFGPNGVSYPMGSESSLVHRLVGEGYSAWHVRPAIVEHIIRQFQTQVSWVLQRAVRYGRGEYRRAHLEDDTRHLLWPGIPRYLYRESGCLALKIASSFTARNSAEIFIARWDFNRILGQMIEARRMFKEGRKPATTPGPTPTRVRVKQD